MLRNLCATEWLQQHPNGLKSDFDAYYKILPEDQKQVRLLEMLYQYSFLTLYVQSWKDQEAKAKRKDVSVVHDVLFCLLTSSSSFVQKKKASNSNTAPRSTRHIVKSSGEMAGAQVDGADMDRDDRDNTMIS